MKKILLCIVLSLFFLAPATDLRAQDLDVPAPAGAPDPGVLGSPSARPPVASEAEIAMIYWQLARKTPDFDAIAKQTDEYKKADPFEREQVLAAQKTSIKNVFDNISFSQPTIVRMVAHISGYSEKNKGFVITDFEDQTYYKYSFAGENYAIVPRGLMDQQFLGPIDDQAVVRKISNYDKARHQFHLVVYLKPDYADPPDTLTEIDGKRYHIISGLVSHVVLYDMFENEMLWGRSSDEFNKQQQDQLMNLKQ